MNILTICDSPLNCKGDILNFGNLYKIYELLLDNDKIKQLSGKLINFENIEIVIFNFNEDNFLFDPKLKEFTNNIGGIKCLQTLFKKISNTITKKYPSIKIYNDPNLCYTLGDKVALYDKIKNIHNSTVKCPKYKKISTENDIDDCDFYPLILKNSTGSHTTNDVICKNYEEFITTYNQHFKNQENVFVAQYVNSKIDELDCYHSVRLMVVNNILTVFHCRPGSQWNIHVNDQIAGLRLKSDAYFKTYLGKNKKSIQEYLNTIHSIFGNGFFAIDCLVSNSDNCLYICEIGLKTFDDTNNKFLKKHTLHINNNDVTQLNNRKIIFNILQNY